MSPSHFSVEGRLEFHALLLVPRRALADFDTEINITLYVRLVFIMEVTGVLTRAGLKICGRCRGSGRISLRTSHAKPFIRTRCRGSSRIVLQNMPRNVRHNLSEEGLQQVQRTVRKVLESWIP